MPEVPVINKEHTEYIDVCTKCLLLWFDTYEFESLPKVEVKKTQAPPLSIDAREALAMERLELLKKQQRQDDLDSRIGPDHWWEVVLALFGMPAEYNYTSLKHKPIITWSLAAVIVLVSLITFRNLRPAVMNFEMIPAQFTRYFGFTFISSFFLHGDYLHLIGNLYFLIVFGDNTEDVLGKRNYLLLITIATVVGHIAHIIADPASKVPCIGASGGISGILAYYCLRFPKAKVGIILLFRWIRIPVVFMLIIWIIFQIIGAYRQILDLSNVSALAHLGGASVGIIFWLGTRRSFSKTAAE
jgi:membrane associated rhomboid family serine protease